ncbi:hypothetical protein D3C85_1607290 [compost metagenome]
MKLLLAPRVFGAIVPKTICCAAFLIVSCAVSVIGEQFGVVADGVICAVTVYEPAFTAPFAVSVDGVVVYTTLAPAGRLVTCIVRKLPSKVYSASAKVI